MMLRPLRLTHLAAPVAALSLVLASGPGEAVAAAHSAGWPVDAGGSLVLCTSVPLPVPVPVSATGHAPVRRIEDGRFFAPTRQAMFFSHPGDRCVWHAGGPARG